MVLLLTFLATLGCQTAGVSERNDGVFQKDLLIYSEGRRFVGFGVLPPDTTYLLALQSRKEPEIVRVSNCHRDVVLREVDDNELSYRFTPNRKVEDGSCLLQITFLDEKGYHQFAAVSFRDESESLPVSVYCNGSTVYYEGASVCQGKAGTLQAIEFDVPVEVLASSGCKLPTTKDDGYLWHFSVKEGYCVFDFKSEDDEFHRLTTFGYNNLVKQ